MQQEVKYIKVWKAEEDAVLKKLAFKYRAKNWKKIARELTKEIRKVRSGKQCRERYTNHLIPKKLSPIWTEKEIKSLFQYHSVYGNRWSKISRFIPCKSKNSIKNFYHSTLRRNLRRFNFGKSPDQQIRGPIFKLTKIPEIYEILTKSKSCLRRSFSDSYLSEKTLKLIQEINFQYPPSEEIEVNSISHEGHSSEDHSSELQILELDEIPILTDWESDESCIMD
ncbi:hypothetical protein SteCoe_24351 [Stentor coeruleus]|uniref:Myb-like DNA-binding domain containing protein n=1 Tax=Stentor coeruleus TaxID=5963 RepID=A0A1R2BI53_9CILI|nr:hypothetical protein SteCoe_24351 [Stentor coeruleus]